jgi:hypothetical protein
MERLLRKRSTVPRRMLSVHWASPRLTGPNPSKGRSAFGVRLEPAKDLRPALMARARLFLGETRMGQSNRRSAVLFIQIEPHQRLGRIFVPRRQPGEGEYARTFDDPIDAFDLNGLPIPTPLISQRPPGLKSDSTFVVSKRPF